VLSTKGDGRTVLTTLWCDSKPNREARCGPAFYRIRIWRYFYLLAGCIESTSGEGLETEICGRGSVANKSVRIWS